MIQEAINRASKPCIDERGRSRQRTPKTIRNIHGLLSAVLAEYCPNLQLHTTLPQKERKEQRILEPEQIAVLLEAVSGTDMEVPILLAVWLCMRASEIMGLTWDCVDFDRGTVTVKKALVRGKDNERVEKTTKTASSTRTISAPDYIMDKLREAQAQAETDHVVTIRGNGLYKRLKIILRKNNLPDIRFHDLRHPNVKPRTQTFSSFLKFFKAALYAPTWSVFSFPRSFHGASYQGSNLSRRNLPCGR